MKGKLYYPIIIMVVVLTVLLVGCGGGSVSLGSNGLTSAELIATPSSGTSMTLIELKVAGVDDKGRFVQPLQSCWDWENDGVMDTPFLDGTAVERVYPAPGEYTVSVTVRDAAGNTAVASRTLDIAPDDNPMVVMANVSPESGTTQTTFTFSAYGLEFLAVVRDQLIPGGYLRWDWEDDGIFDTPFKYYEPDSPPDMPELAPRIEHQFTTPGVKQVCVQLKRLNGTVGAATVMVTVTGD